MLKRVAYLGKWLAHLGKRLAYLGKRLAYLGKRLAHLGVAYLEKYERTIFTTWGSKLSEQENLAHYRPSPRVK